MTYNAISIFQKLFSGNTKAYGQFTPSTIKAEEGFKQEGTAKTVQGNVTESLYRQHLEGSKGLGICPVTAEGKCKFTVIDIDVYDKTQTSHYLTCIAEYGFPLTAFRSKSGGLHLYTFYTDFISAKQAKANANFMRLLLGLDNKTEIFPKQNIILEGKAGNWINLPYFGGDESTRTLLNTDGTPIQSVDMAMAICEENCITPAQFTSWKESLPLNDAPPCLQCLYLMGDVKERNNYLFSLACYYKAKYGEDFEQYLYEANEKLFHPLPKHELEQTVLSSHRKSNYSYRCRETPLCGYCDKAECSLREFKVGETVSELSYEQLVQYNSDPPYYDWTINGKVLRFDSEAEIIQQDKFLELCMRNLGILPNKLKREAWTAIINNALKNKEVKEVEYDTSSTMSMIKEAIKVFMLGARLGVSIDDSIGVGRPYLSSSNKQIMTTMKDLYVNVLTQTKLQVNSREIANFLSALDGVTSVRKVGSMSLRVWIVPLRSFFDNEQDLELWWNSQIKDDATLNEEGDRKSAESVAQDILKGMEETDL